MADPAISPTPTWLLFAVLAVLLYRCAMAILLTTATGPLTAGDFLL